MRLFAVGISHRTAPVEIRECVDFARRAIGWSGRRAAWLSALAFVVVLLNLVPVGYFLTRSHNF